MEIGIQVVGPYDHVRRIGQMCENAGIAAVALADHYLYGSDESAWSQPAYDSLVQAAALARDTSSVEIVMLVSPITFRHPAVYAKTVTTIDEISQGRFVFGLGTGWHEGEHDVFGFEFGTLSERFEWLEDALGYLRVFLDDPTQGYSGRFWSLKALDINPRARSDLRLLVGGGGAVKTPTLVGRFADEYNLYRHEEADVSARLDVMRSAAVEAGRTSVGRNAGLSVDQVLVFEPVQQFGHLGARDAEMGGQMAGLKGSVYVQIDEDLGGGVVQHVRVGDGGRHGFGDAHTQLDERSEECHAVVGQIVISGWTGHVVLDLRYFTVVNYRGRRSFEKR